MDTPPEANPADELAALHANFVARQADSDVRRATLEGEIARLREALDDTLDHRDRLHFAAELERKERELADLLAPEPAPSAPSNMPPSAPTAER